MADTLAYDPLTYWNARANPNAKGHSEMAPGMRIWSGVEKHIREGEKLFELGPGVGRLFGLYEGHRLTTLDISRNYEQAISDAAREHGVSVEQHFSDDPKAPFPFDDDAFDLAIAVQVFIHIPFHTVRHTLSELGRVSKRALIISSHVPSWPNAAAEASDTDYCFNHEYFIALTEMGFAVSDVEIFPDAKHFVYA